MLNLGIGFQSLSSDEIRELGTFNENKEIMLYVEFDNKDRKSRNSCLTSRIGIT